jgi:DNA-binding MarR family transcriptional regulator
VSELNEIIHQPVRLKIMATLRAMPKGALIEFIRLNSIIGTTEGNLGAHITTLENHGYLTVKKDFFGKRPRTRVGVTHAGRRAFEAHVAYLRDVIDAAPPQSSPGETK